MLKRLLEIAGTHGNALDVAFADTNAGATANKPTVAHAGTTAGATDGTLGVTVAVPMANANVFKEQLETNAISTQPLQNLKKH